MSPIKFIVYMMFVSSCVAQTKELSSSFIPVKTNEIHFEQLSFEKLKAKAKKENKLIFINVSMASCIPCKDMEKQVFTDAAVADYYNPNFINASYDYDGKEGQEVCETYQVQCFPNFLFINGDGKIVHRRVGFLNQEAFLKLAETVFNSNENLLYYEEKYPEKKSDPEFLLNYLRILDKSCCMPLKDFFPYDTDFFTKRDSLLKEYFSFQSEEMLTSRVNWNAIKDFTYDYKSREFSYLLKNAALFKKLYTEDSVNSKIKDVFLTGIRVFGGNRANTEAKEIEYMNEIKKMNSAETGPSLFWLSLHSAKKSQKWQDYMSLVIGSGDEYIRSSEEKEKVSKTIHENIDDKAALQKAEKIMRGAAEKDPGWLVYETYANILYKLNKKNEAKAMALNALELAKKIGAKPKNYNSITYLLEKIEKLPAQ